MMRLRYGAATLSAVLLALVLLLIAAQQLYAMPAGGEEYLYQSKSGGELVYYRIHPVVFHGIRAREVVWEDHRMLARHVLNASNGRPLYMSRVDKQGGDHVEVTYHSPSDGGTHFTRSNDTAVVEQETNEQGLLDLGTLPVILGDAIRAGASGEMRFSAINYSDGKVYRFRTVLIDHRMVATANGQVRCARLALRLDSWLSSLMPEVTMELPLSQQSTLPFVSYSGPALSGTGTVSLHFSTATSAVAMLAEQ
ncbi:hypothetical protein FE236_08320 [Mariprofundus erugo]|uniref:DUF3108 domain-containing protein n=1 Tax=Mariprofundus erugo TaxID=2528639 RepID=A0A5R9GQH7_9PROT|nr:hypothetical protein [Mariprofundus erugo]TLS67858.1 hypothetical protein FEF65_05260 [Mariprofundus erugo]TLS75979.1 hypothetical protein FE236_08320 [Mariprofundus erugo]